MRRLTTKQFYSKLRAGNPQEPISVSVVWEFSEETHPTKSFATELKIPRPESAEKLGLNIPAKFTHIIESGRSRGVLKYDKGIALKAESACRVMEERGKDCDVWGWAGQFAFDGHLQMLKIKRTHDDPHYSPFPDNCDFRLDCNGTERRIEIKTTRFGERYKECRVYKSKTQSDGSKLPVWQKPDFLIPIKCINEELTAFKIYGYLTWEDVENYGELKCFPEGCRWGIPLESPRIRDYGSFLNVLS